MCCPAGRITLAVTHDAVRLLLVQTVPASPRLPHHTSAVAELEASKSADSRVRRLFVDPLGRHALLSVQSGGGSGGGGTLETFYVDGGLKKVRPLPKLKGLAVTSVAWSPSLKAASFRCVGWGLGAGSWVGGSGVFNTARAVQGAQWSG